MNQRFRLVSPHEDLYMQVVALLVENNLPTADLDESKYLYGLVVENEIVGTGGLEFFDNYALLRSVSVRSDLRNRGLGNLIVRELEAICAARGVSTVFLLTTTAEHFFQRLGYAAIDRLLVPGPIRGTTEFSWLCSNSAAVMKKDLK